jgi:hypothetical protein
MKWRLPSTASIHLVFTSQKLAPEHAAQDLVRQEIAIGAGRCARAAGTNARLADLTRFLTYHEHHGARRWAREAYAQLTEDERNWHGANLDAARAACPTKLDFAQLLPDVDRLLG